ncbi:MAG TPA: hypothetical protein VIM26_15410, partial [Pengzhenrongella sp.]
VGRTLAARLAGLGHEVTIGTRDRASTLARDTPDRMGNPPFSEWLAEHTDVIDLGDITTARGPEMYLPLWLRLWGAVGTGMFNIKVVR